MPERPAGHPPAERACGVLFDLDGTFADTAPDMAFALNRLLQEQGRPTRPFQEIRPHVSHGGRGLIKLGFGLEPEHPEFTPLRQAFLRIYSDNIDTGTRLFPGIEDLLDTLDARSLPWGIVTNKPAWLTDPLMQRLGLSERAHCIVSGDTTAHAKPHPEPILHACRTLNLEPGCCWYLGDAERDIVAGRAAGTRTLVALFGYLAEHDKPGDWGADGMIGHPLDTLGWLNA